MIRLTRYRRDGGRPLLMIHGYSASGTTFAHHSVQPGPARLMHEAGWDVWILDMRTSAGLPTARLPWTFEECALNDIPVAIDTVRRVGLEPFKAAANAAVASTKLNYNGNLSADWTVPKPIGAQAASSKETPAGALTTSLAALFRNSRAKPSIWKPMMPATFSQRLSRPSRQALQWPQVSAP